MGLGESRGRASVPGGESVERLDEDAARASRVGAEETSEVHLERDPVSEGGFLGEVSCVSAVDTLALAPAGGTGRVGVSGRDTESQGRAIKVGPDQATADGGAQEIEQEQEIPPEGTESGAETRREI